MPVSMFVANSPTLVDAIFNLRYRVYVEEEDRFPSLISKRMFDRFDCFKTTTNIIAIDTTTGEPVGTCRSLLAEPLGLPGDEYYDFSDYSKGLPPGKLCTIGMVAVRREWRTWRGLVVALLRLAVRALRMQGGRHVLAPCSPDIVPLLKQMGGRQTAEPFYHGNPPVEMIPMHIDLEHLTPAFHEYMHDPGGLLYDPVHERRLYHKGDMVTRRDEHARECFIVMRGSVDLMMNTPDGMRELVLGPGDVFGEEALLGFDSYLTSARARSRVVDLGVISQEDFRTLHRQDPLITSRLSQMMTDRMQRLAYCDRIAEDGLCSHGRLLARILYDFSGSGRRQVSVDWLANETGVTEGHIESLLRPLLAEGVVSTPKERLLGVEHPPKLRRRLWRPVPPLLTEPAQAA